MCNLNIFIRGGVTKVDNLASFMMATTANSYISNDDGDGLFCSNGGLLVTSKDKIDMILHKEAIENSHFVLSHQRLSTHGHSEDNIQPFESEEFVIAHNGVMNKFATVKDRSDTFGFFVTFLKKFKESKIKERTNKVIDALHILEDGWAGSFSIALYDKIERCMYYFKNASTSIHVYKSGLHLYMTTNLSNYKFKNIINMEFEELKCEDSRIYKIIANKKVLRVVPIYDINVKYGESKYDNNESYYWDEEGYDPKYNKHYKEIPRISDKQKEEDLKTSEIKEEELDVEGHHYVDGKIPENTLCVRETKFKHGCCVCFQDTYLLDVETGEAFCPGCIEEMKTTNTIKDYVVFPLSEEETLTNTAELDKMIQEVIENDKLEYKNK